MQKAGRKRWLLLVLAGLLLIAVFLTSGVGEILTPAMPSAQAAGRFSSTGTCTTNSQRPSFGGTVVIGPDEVLCGNLTSFGGTVEVEGELQGNLTTFNSDVLIQGVVMGGIRQYGGDIALRNGSHGYGGIQLYGVCELGQQDKPLDEPLVCHTMNVWFFC